MSENAAKLSFEAHWTRGSFVLDASFRCAQHVTGLLGRSGSGKTTVLHLIAGLVRPDRGRIALGDTVWCDTTQSIWVPPHKRRVGFVFQDHRLLPHLTVARNLRYGVRSSRESSMSFDNVVDLMELQPLLGSRPSQLSGGEAQRVAIGRALLSSPGLLLLDEPMTGLDQRLRAQITPLLRRVCEELRVPVVYVAHDLSEVMQLTDTAVLMNSGRVAGSGTITQIVADDEAFPVVRDLGLLNVVECDIATGESDDLVALRFGRQRDGERPQFLVPTAAIRPQIARTPVHVAVRPQDIALAKQPLQGTSIQNQIRAGIKSIHVHDRSVVVEADCGEVLLVEVSQRAVRDLQLAVGSEVWLLIKTNALRVV